MIFRITVKDPDGVANSMQEAARRSIEDVNIDDENERELLIDSRREQLDELASTWIEYEEYITIEIDTEANTAVVVPV